MGGAPPASLSFPAPAVPLPKAPTLPLPGLPQMPTLARPAVTVPTLPTAPVVVVPVMRPVTLATVTRNLQAALGTEAPPPAPTSQGFPGFVSRNFNQVSQHQPGASTSNHLSGLANLFTGPATSAPKRRQEARPLPPPVPSPIPTRPATPPKPAVNRPVVLNKPEPPKAPVPPRQLAELPKIVLAPQSKAAPAPQTAPPATRLASQPTPQPKSAVPSTQLPKPVATEAPKPEAPPKAREEDEKKPPLPSVRTGKLSQARAAKTTDPSTTTATTSPKTTETKAPSETPRVEANAPAAEAKPTRDLEPTRPAQECKANDRVDGPGAVAKAPTSAQAADTRVAPPANQEKIAQLRPEANELKVGEVQRQQLNALQTPVTRDPLALAQQSGAGLSAGGGSGQGGGGGQQGRQQRQQEGEEVEEIGGAEALGGDDQVQWWHLRGEENLRVLSSELREAMFLLRTPQRPLGVEPKQVRIQKTARRQQLVEQPQVQVREEEQRQVSGDQVQLEAAELCKSCGHDLGGVDPRRCPACLRQTALATLAWLEADGRFLAYRVFLTLCRQPVASRAVYHLRDFSSLPSGAYCVQAA